MNPFRVLQIHRNFRLFWTGQTVSLIGTWLQQVGQGWLALELTHDNRASAAEMLGLSRQSLYVKLRRFNIGDLAAAPSEE